MKIAMVDLLAQTPFYDWHLAESISPLVDEFTLYITRFHYEPDYFASANFMWLPGFTDRLGVAFSEMPLLRRPVRLLEYYLNWWTLLYRFQSQPPDIVHIQWLPLLSKVSALSEVRFMQYLKSRCIPIVYTVHNYLPHDTSPHKSAIYHQLYQLVDQLIVHTGTDYQRLMRSGIPSGKITEIPQGPVFADQYGIVPVRARQSLGIDPGVFVLLMLGVVRPYKGIEETIRALALITEEHPEIRLWIVGNALDRKYVLTLQQLAIRLGLQHQIEWRLGYVHSSQVGLLHAAADVVLFPYRNISQSGAFLTAAALGKCTLSTPVGGIGEITRDGRNGVQIATAKPEVIAEGIRRCLDLTPEQRIAMGLALRHDVTQTCGWEHIARQTVAVYEKMLSRC